MPSPLCDYYEHIFSRTLSTSELYRVNNQETDTISDELYELIQTGLEYSRMSDGAFDITIGSVSELWDFTTDTPSVPDDTHLKMQLSYVDYIKVTLTTDSDGTHHISMPDRILYLTSVLLLKAILLIRLKHFLLIMVSKAL